MFIGHSGLAELHVVGEGLAEIGSFLLSASLPHEPLSGLPLRVDPPGWVGRLGSGVALVALALTLLVP